MWKALFLAAGICCASNTAWACQDRGVLGTWLNGYTGTCLGDYGDDYFANGGTMQAAPAPATPAPGAPVPAGPSVAHPEQWSGQVGNWCYTDSGNYPGPWNPVASHCLALTPYGVQQGLVNRGWAQ
jgi:hypothetical protein